MHIRWEDGFEIRTSIHESAITLSANREGMISLANILLDLANDRPGTHVHLDEFNSLENESCELIIERTA